MPKNPPLPLNWKKDSPRIAVGKPPLYIEGKISSEGSIYACGRVIGEWVVWGPTSMQLAVMVWLVWMFQRAKDRAV